MQAFAIMRALTYLSWQSIATYTHQKKGLSLFGVGEWVGGVVVLVG